jgi:hypothetical protein
MKLEKIKRKIAEGLTDEEVSNISGISVEEVANLRAPKKPAPVVKKPSPKLNKRKKG